MSVSIPIPSAITAASILRADQRADTARTAGLPTIVSIEKAAANGTKSITFAQTVVRMHLTVRTATVLLADAT